MSDRGPERVADLRERTFASLTREEKLLFCIFDSAGYWENRAIHYQRIVTEIQEWIESHRVGNGGFDCVQARDVHQILERVPVSTEASR